MDPQTRSPNSSAGAGIELTQSQVSTLQSLHSVGYQIVAFPMYASHIGIRRGVYAALLAPTRAGTFEIYGTPGHLLNDNIAVLIKDGPREFFVWKKDRVEATPALLSELQSFTADLQNALLPHA